MRSQIESTASRAKKTMAMLVLILAAVVGPAAALWVEDEQLRSVTEARSARSPATWASGVGKPQRYTLNLDAAPEDRWTPIASLPYFREHIGAAVEYLADQVPAWLLPLVETIGKDLHSYFGPELGGELVGLANAFGDKIKLGDLVAVNLIMQLEFIGLNCSNWNSTGPTIPNDPGCMDVDPKQAWCYCRNTSNPRIITKRRVKESLGIDTDDAPGMCTSVVAQDSNGHVFHGRNLDWNIPTAVRMLVADIDFQRGNETVFTGTTAVGFVGVFNGIKRGAFSVSIDARGKGGKPLTNILQMLLHKSKTPCQHMRLVLQNASASDFSTAVQMLSEGEQIDENYFIVGGVRTGELAVISRDRSKAADVWTWNASSHDFFLLETNYDHWNPVPKADDRRTPGIAHMRTMGPGGIGDGSGLFDRVMNVWPTKNHHTDYTIIMSASEETFLYNGTVWMD